jgi:hypothetical protein
VIKYVYIGRFWIYAFMNKFMLEHVLLAGAYRRHSFRTMQVRALLNTSIYINRFWIYAFMNKFMLEHVLLAGAHRRHSFKTIQVSP